MEIQENTFTNFMDEESMRYFASRHIEEQIMKRFEKVESELDGKHFYTLKITKTPSRLDYHQFNYEKIQEISRKLTNGLTSLGNQTNRKFWMSNFKGGVRIISIYQTEIEEYPTFSINYLIYSDIDNLDVRINKQIKFRLKMIDQTLTHNFEYLGVYHQSIILENLNFETDVNLNNPILKKLGKRNLEYIHNNQFQKPRFLGNLFKTKTTNENINNRRTTKESCRYST
ncbi:MAG: hypothetical protein AB7S72_14725 [Draconibacterium sp.]